MFSISLLNDKVQLPVEATSDAMNIMDSLEIKVFSVKGIMCMQQCLFLHHEHKTAMIR